MTQAFCFSFWYELKIKANKGLLQLLAALRYARSGNTFYSIFWYTIAEKNLTIKSNALIQVLMGGVFREKNFFNFEKHFVLIKTPTKSNFNSRLR